MSLHPTPEDDVERIGGVDLGRSGWLEEELRRQRVRLIVGVPIAYVVGKVVGSWIGDLVVGIG